MPHAELNKVRSALMNADRISQEGACHAVKELETALNQSTGEAPASCHILKAIEIISRHENEINVTAERVGCAFANIAAHLFT